MITSSVFDFEHQLVDCRWVNALIDIQIEDRRSKVERAYCFPIAYCARRTVLMDEGAVTGIKGRSIKGGAVVEERAKVVIGGDGRYSMVARPNRGFAVAPTHDGLTLTVWPLRSTRVLPYPPGAS